MPCVSQEQHDGATIPTSSLAHLPLNFTILLWLLNKQTCTFIIYYAAHNHNNPLYSIEIISTTNLYIAIDNMARTASFC